MYELYTILALNLIEEILSWYFLLKEGPEYIAFSYCRRIRQPLYKKKKSLWGDIPEGGPGRPYRYRPHSTSVNRESPVVPVEDYEPSFLDSSGPTG